MKRKQKGRKKRGWMVLILAAWREKQKTWGQGSEGVATPGPQQGHLIFLRDQLWGHPNGT